MKTKWILAGVLILSILLTTSCLVLSDAVRALQNGENQGGRATAVNSEPSDGPHEGGSGQESEGPTPEDDGKIAPNPPDESENEPAPEFTLQKLDGEWVALSDFRGKAVLINFWATWCPPCREEMPLIQAVAEQYPQDLVILAINAGEHEDDVRRYVEAHDFDMVFLLDPENSAATAYTVRGFPTSFFVDTEGVLQGTYIGELDETLLTAYLGKIGIGE